MDAPPEEDLAYCEARGIAYDPFSRRARLSRDTSVNYLAHFRRPAKAA